VQQLLPTFLIIGAAKSGTTSLHEYLAVHPEVAMTSNKEPMCFEPPHWRERLAEYAELFDRPAPVRGESSTAYSAYPWVPEIPDRVRETIPGARIVYVVRDPIPRTLTHWSQNRWDGKPVAPFEELMADLEDPMNMPVWCSRYATQIERWLERFPHERVLVVDQHDLLTDRAATLRRVFAFLEVDPGFSSPNWDAEHNTAASHRVPNALHARLGRLGPRVARVPGLRAAVTDEVPRPRLTDDQRERLEAVLRPEVARLRELTGQRFASWSL
jgi:hypothetical protein